MPLDDKRLARARETGELWGGMVGFFLPVVLVLLVPSLVSELALIGAVVAFGQIPLMIWLGRVSGQWCEDRARRRVLRRELRAMIRANPLGDAQRFVNAFYSKAADICTQ